jgi:hypothetical protein
MLFIYVLNFWEVRVLYRQLGARIAIFISVYTVFLGLLIGAILNMLIK